MKPLATKPALIEALGTTSTLDQAADHLGYHDKASMRRRMRALGVRRVKHPECMVIEVRQ